MSKYNKLDGIGNGREASEIAGRKKTMQLGQIKNMFSENADVKLRVRNDSKKQPYRTIQGKVIGKNDYFVTLSVGTVKESFQFSEFLQGRAKIILN